MQKNIDKGIYILDITNLTDNDIMKRYNIYKENKNFKNSLNRFYH